MKQRLLIIFMLLTTIVTGAWAQNVASVKIGNTIKSYSDFIDAWDAANVENQTSTITLLSSVNVSETLMSRGSANITLIGNNFSLTRTGSSTEQTDALFYIGSGKGSFTIKSGCFSCQSSDCISIFGDLTLNIEGGEFSTSGKNKHDIYCDNGFAHVNITGGEFKYTKSGGQYHGGIQAAYGYRVRDCAREGYALYAGWPWTPVKLSALNSNQFHEEFKIDVCQHTSFDHGKCEYCGKQAEASVKIGETTTAYSTFDAALSAAQNASSAATITLLNNCFFSKGRFMEIPSGKNITFEGGDYTLELKDYTYLLVNGDFTIKSGKIKVWYTSNCGYAVMVYDGHLTMAGGIIDASQSGYAGVVLAGKNARFTMTGGEVWGDAISGYNKCYALLIDDGRIAADQINISGGKLRGYNGAVYFRDFTKKVQSILAPGCCLSKYDSKLEDGFEYVDANTDNISGNWNTVYQVTSPVAATSVGSAKKVYNNFNNAWKTVNVGGTASNLYLLKNVTTSETLSPVAGSNITLEALNNDVTLTRTGSETSEEKALFFVNIDKSATGACNGYHTEGLTINSGKYVCESSDVITVKKSFPVIINGGVFQTNANYKHDIFANSSTIDVHLNGGQFNYSGTDDAGIGSVTGNRIGGIHIGVQGRTVGSGLPNGKAFWPVTPNAGNTPIAYSPTLENYLLHRAVYIDDHECEILSSTSKCKYCNKSLVKVARIDSKEYTNLQLAFDEATSGQTVTLLVNYDIADNDYINVKENVTFDLNGHNVAGSKAGGTNGVSGLLHLATADKTLTITGTSGSITNNNAAGAAVSLKAGNVTTSGQYQLSSLATTGNVTLSSGKFATLKAVSGIATISPAAAANITIGSATVNGGVISIHAGTFGFDPEAYTVPSSAIAKTENPDTWTVTANQIVAYVSVGSTTTKHASMEDALAAANAASEPATITLVTNVTSTTTGDFKITNTHGVTFECGEYTYDTHHNFVVNGKMIMNSGTIKITEGSTYAFWLGGTLELNDGTIDCTGYSGGAIYISGGSASMTVTGGAIKGVKHALCMQESFDPSNFHLSGGTFTSTTESSLYIPSWANTSHNVNRLLKRGYDLYDENGSVINANVKTINNKHVHVAPATTFTAGNLKYTVTRNAEGEQKDQYTVACTGYDGEVPSSITFPETATDPNNSINVFVVDSIANSAFSGMTNLTSISLSDKIKGIGRFAFFRTSLVELTIPENVEWIDKEAFEYITTLRTINYNAKNVKDNDYSWGTQYNLWRPFYNSDEYVTAVNIGANVESIPDYLIYMLGYANECTITANPAVAPAIKANTFSAETKNSVCHTVTLVTPNNIDNSYDAWGFKNYKRGMLCLSDTFPTLHAGTYAAGKATYTRSGSDGFYSYCLPFNTTIPEGVFEKLYVPVGVALINTSDKLCILFEQKLGDIEKNTPFVGKWKESAGNTQVVFTSSEETIINDASKTNPKNTIRVYDFAGSGNPQQDDDYEVKWCGTNIEEPYAEGQFSFNADGTVSPRTSIAMKAFRAYITKIAKTSVAQARPLTIVGVFEDENGEVTGILELISGKQTQVAKKGVYTIDGTYLGDNIFIESLPKGIYIINGKRIIKQ